MDLNLPQRAVPDRVSVTEATLQAAWDDALLLRVNGEVFELGKQHAFRARRVPVRLRAGANVVTLKLSNTRGSNHGGCAFAFRAEAADGTLLRPRAG
ncbi:MAG: hypothetical protein OXH98_16200 [Caldilineaceae bacterium]|nr:hypothetical protein [Caldilineaceae bacterium]